MSDRGQETESAAAAHARMCAEQPFAGELASLHELTHGFVATLRLAWLAATRDPAWANSLFWRFVDDLVASAVAIELLVREGIDTTARRELRFMLELVVRHLYVDSCAMAPTSPFETRMGYVGRQLGTRDVELVADLPLTLLGDKEAFRQATRRLYGELSRYTHPTREQLARRLERADRGAHIGFETAEDVAAFNELLRRAYDVLIALIFEALGPRSAGDLMLAFDDVDDWPFHQTPFVAQVSASFDYKAERKSRRARD